MLSYGRHGGVGGGGGVITFLTSIKHGPRNLLPLLTCCFSRQGGGGGEMYGIIENHKFLMFLL